MPRLTWTHFFFPGLIFHELSHYMACVLCSVKVNEVKLFSLSEAYVAHEKPNAWQSVLISAAPFLTGNILSFFLLTIANRAVSQSPLLSVFLYWLSVSIVFFAFPSEDDALNAFNSVKDFYRQKLTSGKIPARLLWLITAPFVFVPLLFIAGFMLVFDYFVPLKLCWVLGIVLFSWFPVQIANIFI